MNDLNDTQGDEQSLDEREPGGVKSYDTPERPSIPKNWLSILITVLLLILLLWWLL